MQGLCMCGELRADTKKGDCMGLPVNQNRTGRGFDLIVPHGAAVSQNVWVCFSEGARFPLSWDVATTLRQPRVYSSTSLSTSHASHAHRRPKKWASRRMTHSIDIGYHLNSVPASLTYRASALHTTGDEYWEVTISSLKRTYELFIV